MLDSKSQNTLGVKIIRELKLENLIFILAYILIFVYILIFRLIYNVVGSGEPEYYPMEVITTIIIILSIVVSYLIYNEHQNNTGEHDLVFVLLFIFFCAYFLAENNWLFGRENVYGTVGYAIFSGIVFILVLSKTYPINRCVFIIFLLAVICLAIGSMIDAIIDGIIPITFNVYNRILYEEISEVYASLFFLHSILLLYLHVTHKKAGFDLDKQGTLIIVTSAIIIGCGNLYLLLDHGQPIQMGRLLIGIILYLFGLFVVIGYFIYFWHNDRKRYWKTV
ncbi:MAG: hypothetical protein KAJ51_13340 [Thermoplasmata archaeon]|nr:hypothetical protein [Thermoplasmata archaeon]